MLSWHLLLHRVYNRDNLLVLTFPACPLLMYVPGKKCKMVSVFTFPAYRVFSQPPACLHQAMYYHGYKLDVITNAMKAQFQSKKHFSH